MISRKTGGSRCEALALVLRIVSGLMVHTYVALRSIQSGFTSPEQVQTFSWR